MSVFQRSAAAVAGGLALAVLSPRAASALSWADLWQRPDQRAQQLLNAGDAAAAAPLFDDPRRKGFAELRSQQFDAAAKQLQGLKDPESLYNRGNALAHAGDLKGALDAYDAALAALPQAGSLRADAQHNRDLVAKQLESQPQQSKPNSGKDKGKDGAKDQSQQGDSQGAKDQPQDASNPPKAADQQSPRDQQSPSDQQGQPGQQPPQPAQQQAQQPAQQTPQGGAAQGQQAGQPPGAKDAPPAGAPPGKASGQAPSPGDQAKPDSAAAALADARAGLQDRPPPTAQSAQPPAKPPSPVPSAGAKRDAKDARASDAAGAMDAAPKPESEQQLALEQWLRWIPDDPAGLLRRKFMIEHMLKQREEQQ